LGCAYSRLLLNVADLEGDYRPEHGKTQTA
jgi:hypothetical protein